MCDERFSRRTRRGGAWKRAAAAFVFAACSIIVSPAPAAELDWREELVDDWGEFGEYHPSLALDAEGRPHIAYGAGDQMRFAYWDGVTWRNEVIWTDTELWDGWAGQTQIARDGDQYHVLFEGRSTVPGPDRNWWLWYAKGAPGSTWEVERFLISPLYPSYPDIPPNTYASLKIDTNGLVHLIYNSFGDLVYLRNDPTGWLKETVYGGLSLQLHSNLALDSQNVPYVAFQAGPQLLLAYRSGTGNWPTREIHRESNGVKRFMSSLAIDSSNNPHVAFAHRPPPESDFADLRYARWDGVQWQTEIAATSAGEPLLQIDLSDRPHLFYEQSVTPEEAKRVYARKTDQGWQTGHEFARETGLPAFVLDADDNAHITLIRPIAPYRGVWHIRYAPAWEIHVVDSADVIRDCAVVLGFGGVPHISYSAYDPLRRVFDLRYATRSRKQWHVIEVARGQFEGRGYYSSIALPALGYLGLGFPRIASYTPETDDLEFSVYDPLADRWNTELVHDPANDDFGEDVGKYCNLLIGGDNEPRIAYWDATHNRVKFAWKDSQSWHVTANTAGPVLDSFSGQISYELPANWSGPSQQIAYIDAERGDVRLAVWSGQTWTDEAVSDGNTHIEPPIAVAWRGKDSPFIAYYDSLNDRILLKTSSLPNWESVASDVLFPPPDMDAGIGAYDEVYIAYAEDFSPLKALKVAFQERSASRWEVTEIDTGYIDDLSLQTYIRPVIAYRGGPDGTELRLAVRIGGRLLPPFDPLRPCRDESFPSQQAAGRPLLLRKQATPVLDPETRDDLAILRALRDLFVQSEEGTRLLNLYYAHAVETGAIGLTSPTLSIEAFSVIRNFLPGFLGLVNGEGEKYTITQSMVDGVNEVWDGLEQLGSPALATAIQTERARFDNLQRFVGMNFVQWAQELGVLEKPATARRFDKYR